MMLDALKTRLGLGAAPVVNVNDKLDHIDEVREQIAQLKGDRRAIATAPRPLAEVVEALDRWLDRAATDAIDGLSLHHLLHRDGRSDLRLSTTRDPATDADRLLGLLVASNRAALRKLLVGQLGQISQNMGEALTDDDITMRLEQCDNAIFAAELSEEAAIRALERSGVAVQRRADAAPIAVLAADDSLPA